MTSVLAHDLVADPTAFEMPAGLPSDPEPARQPGHSAPRPWWQSAPVAVIDWRNLLCANDGYEVRQGAGGSELRMLRRPWQLCP